MDTQRQPSPGLLHIFEDVAPQPTAMQPSSEMQKIFSDGQTTTRQPSPALQSIFDDTILPNPVPVTQPFGNYNPSVEKYSGGINYGTDFGAKTGTPVSLPHGKWEVVEANSGGFNRGYGNSIQVKDLTTGYMLRLSHLSDMIQVKPGQTLPGGLVGHSGSSGNTTGPHLDIETHDPQGRIIDVLKSPYAKYIKTK